MSVYLSSDSHIVYIKYIHLFACQSYLNKWFNKYDYEYECDNIKKSNQNEDDKQTVKWFEKKNDKYGRQNETIYTYFLFLKKRVKQWNGKKKSKHATQEQFS